MTLNGKIVSCIQTNDPFVPTTSSNDGSNIELYFDGYSHASCANAEYLGDVVAYDTYVWVSLVDVIFHFTTQMKSYNRRLSNYFLMTITHSHYRATLKIGWKM